MRVCPECQTVVRDTANFCDNCGHAFGPVPAAPKVVSSTSTASQASAGGATPGTCSACGYLNVPGEMFCQNCGVQLAPVASSPPPLPKAVTKTETPAVQEQPPNRCPTCGYRIGPEDIFCQNCGAQISTAATAESDLPAETDESATAVEQAKLTIKLVVGLTDTAILLDADRNEWLVGRSDPIRGIFPEVDLGTHGGDKSGVSRRHARLSAQEGQRFVSDLNSTNFTFLNGEKLEPGKLYPLKDGDEIRFGLLALQYFEEISE